MSTQTTINLGRLLRTALLILGLAVFGVGVATLVVVEPLVYELPSEFAVVTFAGILAVVLGLWVVRNRYRSEVTQTHVPTVEALLSTPAPGHEIDRALQRLTQFREGTIEYRDQIQERLASAATAVIRRREDCSEGEAVRQLDEGSWTDNEYAAAFFTGGNPPKQSIFDRVVASLFGERETPYEGWVRITVDTIARKAELRQTTATSDSSDRDGLLPDFGDTSPSTGDTVLSRSDYLTANEDEDGERDGEIVYGELVYTNRWRGISAIALVAVGWGLITLEPSVVLVSVIGIGLAAAARTASEPSVAGLDVDRNLSNETPRPGELVEVTVTVKNTGDSFMSDLRLVDRVPGSMEVVDGSPRLATALGADQTASFSYEVVAQRGQHDWPLIVLARDVTGSIEREVAIDVETGMDCVPALRTTANAAVRSKTSLFSGQVGTDVGGSGLEFFSVREYREGDPMKRIDWKRHARTGELATIDFRQEHAVKVVLLFDARDSAYVSPAPGERHAVDLSVAAGMELFSALFDRSDLTGIAAFDTIPCWLGTGAGDDHRERARQLFARHPALSSFPPELKDVEGSYVDPMKHVRRQLPVEAQVMLFSPLCDDYTAEVARRLDSLGHLVTVISPDPTNVRTIGQRLAQIERKMRIVELRERGIRVIDWEVSERLELELDRAEQRWAA